VGDFTTAFLLFGKQWRESSETSANNYCIMSIVWLSFKDRGIKIAEQTPVGQFMT